MSSLPCDPLACRGVVAKTWPHVANPVMTSIPLQSKQPRHHLTHVGKCKKLDARVRAHCRRRQEPFLLTEPQSLRSQAHSGAAASNPGWETTEKTGTAGGNTLSQGLGKRTAQQRRWCTTEDFAPNTHTHTHTHKQKTRHCCARAGSLLHHVMATAPAALSSQQSVAAGSERRPSRGQDGSTTHWPSGAT
jgi:ribosomal protein L34E